eukprot:101571-Pelagomonas_calceolata.AAC.2
MDAVHSVHAGSEAWAALGAACTCQHHEHLEHIEQHAPVRSCMEQGAAQRAACTCQHCDHTE